MTLVINAAAGGFAGDAGVFGWYEHPICFYHFSDGCLDPFENEWSGTIGGARYTVDGDTSVAFHSDGSFAYSVALA